MLIPPVLQILFICIVSAQWEKGENWITATGMNTDGILGQGNTRSTLTPVIIPGLVNISQVSVDRHALILLADGSVYSQGQGGPLGVLPGNGRLGHGDLNPREVSPRFIQGLRGIRIVQVSAGTTHSIVRSSTNEIYGFGWNDVGESEALTNREVNCPWVIRKLDCLL
jgi:alpha-tubulin suppressor-like RCC1 family protein